jgi:cobyric acid synthase CobQ/L-threonine-O-3-phosphate decarboxylase
MSPPIPNVTHGGNPAAVAATLGLKTLPPVRFDFSVNVNPLGAPDWVCGLMACAADRVEHYPEVYAESATRALAAAHGVAPETLLTANGSTEIFAWLVGAFKARRPAWVAPGYGGYAEACAVHGLAAHPIPASRPETAFAPDWARIEASDADLVFLASPNNPTGTTLDPEAVLALARRQPARLWVLDEAFMDFLPDAARRTLIGRALPPNLVVVKSLTKAFAIPGLRLGLCHAAPDTLSRVAAARLPWTVNGPAQAVAARLYEDPAYLAKTRRVVEDWRAGFRRALARIAGLEVFPSEAPYLLCRLPAGRPGRVVQAALLERGILIRSCRDFAGLDDPYIRLAVRAPAEQTALVDALTAVLGGRQEVAPAAPRPAPAIMVVGTTSNAGKSLVAAGLCRVFARRGLRVAPFKAQNMALNSFVTEEGGEMGRAQVTQAAAARVKPHTDMNPVLLKPTGAGCSQVIVNGKAIGLFSARDYYARKAELRLVARAAYDRLQARHDLVVLEGAGSPAEINLKEEDFVNMDMAAYAGAATILVADIDRGGVFASILGTLALLSTPHRRLVRGVVINKFRGDASLLTPGLRQIEAMTGVPVLGVLPYLSDLRVEEEDSLGLENRSRVRDGGVDIAVVRLPRISNYTDFLALERRSGVGVRYVQTPRALDGADLVILPGSKNTRADLRYLHEAGFSARIAGLHRAGTPVFGICGGYQMLGAVVADPLGVEGAPGSTDGLGLLPVTTVLEAGKELAQVEGVTTAACAFAPAGTRFKGYEIHAGRTEEPGETEAPLRIERRRNEARGEAAGAWVENGGTVAFGTYVHGLFDAAGMGEALVRWLRARRGDDPDAAVNAMPETADPMDRVADMLETELRLDDLLKERVNS